MTTEAHVHCWQLEAGIARDVPGECACGETRIFKGMEENTPEAYRKAKGSLYSRAHDADQVNTQVKRSFRWSTGYE